MTLKIFKAIYTGKTGEDVEEQFWVDGVRVEKDRFEDASKGTSLRAKIVTTEKHIFVTTVEEPE